VAILLRDRARHQTLQHITTADTVADPDFGAWLGERNRSGADIFLGMNPLKESATSRTKGNILEIRHLYLDLDENAADSLRSICNSVDVPKPNFVLDTSPGKHQVVWKIEGVDQEQAESLLRSMAREFGGDPAATDSMRVLRMPGFVNRKYAPAEEFVVRVHQESAQVYHLRDFIFEDAPPETPNYLDSIRPTHRMMPRGHESQSEHDWAYAKRALARGDDPETVIQRIADYRAQDKSDPEYYARLTVTKAAENKTANPTHRSLAGSEATREPDH
jgi:RepB DNA-primase from phage plasmid